MQSLDATCPTADPSTHQWQGVCCLAFCGMKKLRMQQNYQQKEETCLYFWPEGFMFVLHVSGFYKSFFLLPLTFELDVKTKKFNKGLFYKLKASSRDQCYHRQDAWFTKQKKRWQKTKQSSCFYCFQNWTACVWVGESCVCVDWVMWLDMFRWLVDSSGCYILTRVFSNLSSLKISKAQSIFHWWGCPILQGLSCKRGF